MRTSVFLGILGATFFVPHLSLLFPLWLSYWVLRPSTPGSGLAPVPVAAAPTKYDAILHGLQTWVAALPLR